MTNAELADRLSVFLREGTALLQRHEEVAKQVTDYDVNNTYQYIVAREETHQSWLHHALLDLGAQIPAEPSRPTLAVGKGDAWKTLAAEDAQNESGVRHSLASQGRGDDPRPAQRHADRASR